MGSVAIGLSVKGLLSDKYQLVSGNHVHRQGRMFLVCPDSMLCSCFHSLCLTIIYLGFSHLELLLYFFTTTISLVTRIVNYLIKDTVQAIQLDILRTIIIIFYFSKTRYQNFHFWLTLIQHCDFIFMFGGTF